MGERYGISKHVLICVQVWHVGKQKKQYFVNIFLLIAKFAIHGSSKDV
jgi:hypothetical protein